ncbi:hypothetical protein M0Q50_01255 [bacterium]|jgi:hypothetical protein|nr:hypothetical protein [bacterium]
MAKFKYYLGVIDDGSLLNDVHYDILMSDEQILNLGISFSKNGTPYSYGKNVKTSMSFKKMSDLIELYVLNDMFDNDEQNDFYDEDDDEDDFYDDDDNDDDNDEDEDDDEDENDGIVGDSDINGYKYDNSGYEEVDEPHESFLEKILLNKICVLRKYKKSKMYKIVKFEEIRNTYYMIEDDIEDIYDDIKYDITITENVLPENKKIIDDFINNFEKIIEGDECYITLSCSNNIFYNISVMKEGGYLHKRFLEKDIIVDSRNGLVYENGFNDFSKWLYEYSMINSINIMINSTISNDNIKEMFDNGKRIMRKVYGAKIIKTGDKISIKYISANDILLSYTIDIETGDNVKVDSNMIFCNMIDKNDIICGFDLD